MTPAICFSLRAWGVMLFPKPLTILHAGQVTDSCTYCEKNTGSFICSAVYEVPSVNSTACPYRFFQVGPVLVLPSTLWHCMQPLTLYIDAPSWSGGRLVARFSSQAL